MIKTNLDNDIKVFKIINGISKKSANLSNLILFFKKLSLKLKEEQPEAIIIGDYLYNNISSEKVRKRKVSARDFEDVLSLVFDGGDVLDNNKRKNISFDPVSKKKLLPEIQSYVSSNRREKMDVCFKEDFGISVKTSIPDNKEINMGSFAREALFFNFLKQEEYGSERKSGLGSKPQVLEKFKKIEEKGLWGSFSNRFIDMVNFIFVDDLVIVLKNNKSLDLYFIEEKKLKDAFNKRIKKGPKAIMELMNRYEGNSMRIDRLVLTRGIKPIVLDFSKIEKTSYKRISNGLENVGILIREAYRSPNQKNKKLEEVKNTVEDIFKEII